MITQGNRFGLLAQCGLFPSNHTMHFDPAVGFLHLGTTVGKNSGRGKGHFKGDCSQRDPFWCNWAGTFAANWQHRYSPFNNFIVYRCAQFTDIGQHRARCWLALLESRPGEMIFLHSQDAPHAPNIFSRRLGHSPKKLGVVWCEVG